MLQLQLADEAATQALGLALATAIERRGLPQLVLHLVGDLGAGKSTLARALLRGLGVQGAIKSPTYTLVERYVFGGGECLHLDLYRIADPDELDFFGLDELAASARLWLVEWPSRGAERLPPVDLVLSLEAAGGGRRLTAQSQSAAGRALLEALADVGSAAAFVG